MDVKIPWQTYLIGMFIGVGLHRFSGLKKFEVEIAKIYHFKHDRYGIFKRGKHGPRNLSATR
jgi:aquaporin Z